jgi:hypothetical protein
VALHLKKKTYAASPSVFAPISVNHRLSLILHAAKQNFASLSAGDPNVNFRAKYRFSLDVNFSALSFLFLGKSSMV